MQLIQRQGPVVGHFPLYFAVQHGLPFLAEGFKLALLAAPSGNVFKQGPVGQVEIIFHVIQRIARKEHLHRLGKNIAQMKVDGARRAVVVNVGIKI